ncbi:MAG: twin-arginine translocase subunit TatC [bacterium]|nr:twin-arginine translocase subunit TatC [bacterium]
MSLIRELQDVGKSAAIYVCMVLLLSLFFFSFGLVEIEIKGSTFVLPFPDQTSFSVMLFNAIRTDLLPQGVELIVTNPTSAFVSQAVLSILFSVIASFPLLLYSSVNYISSALYPNERKAVFQVLFPSAVLFAGGAFFAYFVIIPAVFSFLYSYVPLVGALPFFSVNEFITQVFGLVLVVGILFLLPIFMFLLTRVGIIGPHFWREHWRYAALSFLILSALVTPDGSGISMLLLSAPLLLLYGVGTAVSKK